MAGYVGRGINYGNAVVDHFTGNGGATYTLTYDTTTDGVVISLDGVVQRNSTDFNIAGTALTFTSVVASPIAIQVIYTGLTQAIGTPSDNTVSASKLQDNSVTGSKIAMGSDAQGDVLYYNGTDYVRLPKGTASQVLKMNSGATAPEWSADVDTTNTNASNLVSGTLPDARFPATLPTASGANLTALPAGNLTGTIADARVPASAVTQHVTGYDDATIKADILKLAISQAVDGNRSAYNLADAFIDGFEDSTGITTTTNVDRNANEYVSSIVSDYATVTSNDLIWIASDNSTNGSSTFTDSSAVGRTVTATNITHSTAEAKFGTSSIYANSSTPGLSVPYASDVISAFDNNFTVDMWVKSSDTEYDFFRHEGSGSYDGLRAHYNAGSPRWLMSTNLSSWAINSTGSNTDAHSNTWTHVAYVRSGSTWNTYVDGTRDLNVTGQSGDPYDSSSLPIDFICAGATGYFDKIRLNNTDRGWTGSSITVPGETVNATGTLISDPQTASSSRTSISGVIIYEDASGTATLGTDLKIYFTANNGSNWTEASSYATAVTYSGTKKLVTLGNTTVTGGTQIAIKADWANQASGSKETRLHGWAVNY